VLMPDKSHRLTFYFGFDLLGQLDRPPQVQTQTGAHPILTGQEKVRLVEEAMQPGMNVSYVSRQAGISPSHLRLEAPHALGRPPAV
jgi:hypothetical protein